MPSAATTLLVMDLLPGAARRMWGRRGRKTLRRQPAGSMACIRVARSRGLTFGLTAEWRLPARSGRSSRGQPEQGNEGIMVDGTTNVSSTSSSGGAARNSYAELNSEDYFKLLINQLTNQDPFEPTSNQELLQQMSVIRQIEASSTLTDSLKTLTNQQQFAAGSAMIGQHVTGPWMRKACRSGHGGGGALRGGREGGAPAGQRPGAGAGGRVVAGVSERIGQTLVGKLVSGVDTRTRPISSRSKVSSPRCGWIPPETFSSSWIPVRISGFRMWPASGLPRKAPIR